MVQLSDDGLPSADGLLTIAAAVAIITAGVKCRVDSEAVALIGCDGRVLVEDIVATRDLPPFDNSAVDGYAVCFADSGAEAGLIVEGRAAAGAEATALRPGTACRIFTGAVMPAGADSVAMQEDVSLDGAGRVRFPDGLRHGANVRRRGEDLAMGSLALVRGQPLRPQDLALAAALGLAHLPVRRPIRVALFSTGDELVAPGRPAGPAQRFDSNRVMLAALLGRAGAAVTDLGILPDRTGAVTAALASSARDHDLILTSGGVSVGEEDHVKAAVAPIGRLVFWQLAMKPGRPVAMGRIAGVPFVGLPGNPVAAFVTFARIVRPLLAALAGEIHAPTVLGVRAAFTYRKKAGRRDYLPVRLVTAPDGGTLLHKHTVEGPGSLTALTRTDGFAELGEEVTLVEQGDVVGYLPFAFLL